jgi:FkbM family methyltransferase
MRRSQEDLEKMLKSFLRPPFLSFARRGLLPGSLCPILYRYLRPEYVTIGDSKMYLGDANWLPLWANGVYEPWTTDIVRRELKQGDVFVDVGANIGYFTVMASKAVGEKGRVYAFEPNPSSFQILKRNVEANGLENTTIEQKAVADFSGRIELWSIEGNTYPWKEEERTAFNVDSVRLDDYFQGQRIDLMKMDIDGGETMALEGSSRVLSNDLGKLIIEFWPTGFKKQNIDPEAFLNMLANGRFSSYSSSALNSSKQADFRKFLEDYATGEHAYYDSLNIFCSKD